MVYETGSSDISYCVRPRGSLPLQVENAYANLDPVHS
jgi:hypothetical protein